MKIDIYKTQASKTFIAVEEGVSVPDDITKQYMVQGLFKKIDLEAKAPMIGLDAKAVAREIQLNGYSVVGAKVIADVRIPTH